VLTKCDGCGAVHGPWGTHAPAAATTYEVWVAAAGTIEAALTVPLDDGTSGQAARRWFASQLERFVAEEHPSALETPVAVLQFGFDADSHWGAWLRALGGPRRRAAPTR
jgi:hypothetical protein